MTSHVRLSDRLDLVPHIVLGVLLRTEAFVVRHARSPQTAQATLNPHETATI
jgi:hypothetical protein